jgi:putative SOS response-associated peptidase YedK
VVRRHQARLAGGDAGWRRIGFGTRLVQGGTTFSFAAPAAGTRMVLRGVVEVQWRDGKEVVDRAKLLTTEGHANSADLHRRVSRSSCEIKR